MTCACKCCCGCCCDGETGSQTLETPCTAPKVFHGKGTICDVCCDLGEIRDDIDSEEDCPGTWVTNGRCLETPCGGGCDCDLSDGNWPPPGDEAYDWGPTFNTNVADNGVIQSGLNSLFSTNKIAWKAGYPDALDGCVTAWWYYQVDYDVTPCPDATLGYCFSGYRSYRLLHATCPDGNVVDITATAVEEIVPGSLIIAAWCVDDYTGGDCPADCCDSPPGDWPPEPLEVIFELPP
jgi:hypothetical protein